jgi:hypothetical protein
VPRVTPADVACGGGVELADVLAAFVFEVFVEGHGQ